MKLQRSRKLASSTSLNTLVVCMSLPRLPAYVISNLARDDTARWMPIENWSICGNRKSEFTKLNPRPTNVRSPSDAPVGFNTVGNGFEIRSGMLVRLLSVEEAREVELLNPYVC